MRAFVNRHMGVPEPAAYVVTTNVAKSLRSYFLGVTIIAAFNGIVIGAAALILGVPLAARIAIVTFVGAYVPFVGAWVAGAFAVLIALGTAGTDAALVMAVVAVLANGALQQDHPAVRHGRNARDQPAHGGRRHDRGRLPVRNGRIDARRPVDVRGRAHR